MKHILDDHLLSMIKSMKDEQYKTAVKVDRTYQALTRLHDHGPALFIPFFRWRHKRLFKKHENISAEIRRFSREARARSLYNYRGKGI